MLIVLKILCIIDIMYCKHYALRTLYWRFKHVTSARPSTRNSDVPRTKGIFYTSARNLGTIVFINKPSKTFAPKNLILSIFDSIQMSRHAPTSPYPSLFSLPHSLAHPPIDEPSLIRPVVLLGKTKRNHNRVYSRLSCINISSLGKLRLSEGFLFLH